MVTNTTSPPRAEGVAPGTAGASAFAGAAQGLGASKGHATGGATIHSATPPFTEASSSESSGVKSPADVFKSVGSDVRELTDFATYYLSARVDQVKLTVRNIGLYAVLGVVGLVVGSGMLVTAGVLIVTGISGALSALFGRREWAGSLVTGVLILGGVAAAAYVAMTKVTKTSHSATVKKYESRRRNQQAEYGTDVHQQAESSGWRR